jgi:hypothetical protein
LLPFFIRGLPTLPLHWINTDSAGNYQLIDQDPQEEFHPQTANTPPPWDMYSESAGNHTISWTRNPQEEWFFRWALQAQGQEIHLSNWILRNNQLMEADSNVIKMKSKPDMTLIWKFISIL